jgi:hypothetical protein
MYGKVKATTKKKAKVKVTKKKSAKNTKKV